MNSKTLGSKNYQIQVGDVFYQFYKKFLAKDIIFKLVCQETKRITASEALEHDFFNLKGFEYDVEIEAEEIFKPKTQPSLPSLNIMEFNKFFLLLLIVETFSFI